MNEIDAMHAAIEANHESVCMELEDLRRQMKAFSATLDNIPGDLIKLRTEVDARIDDTNKKLNAIQSGLVPPDQFAAGVAKTPADDKKQIVSNCLRNMFSYVMNRQKIEAIKELRSLTGMGLADSKRLIEELEEIASRKETTP